MAFVPLTELETNAKKPVRQALIKKLKDNFDDHESRILALQDEVLSFDHFNAGHAGGVSFATAKGFDDTASTTRNDFTDPAKGKEWFFIGNDGNGQNSRKGNDIKPHHSVARMNTNAAGFPTSWGGGDRYMFAMSQRTVRFDQVVKPIILRGRWRIQFNDRNLIIGLYENHFFNKLVGYEDGIYLTRVDGTNWRFLTKFAGSTTNGALITKPANNSWFEVKIEFTDDPVDKVLTSIDTGGGLTQIDDLQVDLPKSISLNGIFGGQTNIGTDWYLDCDRALLKWGALSDAP